MCIEKQKVSLKRKVIVMLKLDKFILLVLILLGAFLSISSCRKKIEVCTDIEFIKQQFPNIKDIEEVKYYYNVKSEEREIGLQNIEFCGFIKIGQKFYEKIIRDYNWKETKKSKNMIPKTILLEGDSEKYNFLYNYDFSYDGKYKSNSWVGDFYLDKVHKVLYFECEW